MINSAVIELIAFLQHYAEPGWPSPLLWVGAGASAQAGYPTLTQIRESLLCELNDSFEGDPIETYVQRFSRVDLMNVLENKFGEPREFAPLHLAIAQMVAADLFHCIITTNYDCLIENALESLNVPYTLQVISRNQELSSRRVPLLIKLHGDRSNWKEAVLDASSYARFENDEPLVAMQLNLLRRAHSVIFLGSSMQDSRIVNWLRALRPDERQLLRAGRVLITTQDWEAIPDDNRKLFKECSIHPVLLENHNEIGELMAEVASRLAPIVESHLALELTADEDDWTIRGPTHEAPLHYAANPLKDEVFVRDLAELETVSRQSVRVNGPLSDQEAVQWASAKKIGQRLTSTLLSDQALQAVRARVNQVEKCRPRLIIRVSDNSPWNKQILSLPWELITLEENHFVVYQGQLEIIREVVVSEAPILAAPTSPLTIAVCFSAPDSPDDEAAFGHEKESYHLARALDQAGRRPAFAELGELNDLVDLIERTRPSVVHFSGTGSGESLIFENEQGFSRSVSADELSRRLNERLRPINRPGHFPPLFFISNCDGKSSFSVKEARAGARDPRSQLSPDTFVAMALHRNGFVQVVDFSGAGFDVLRVRAEETFYSALAQGETTLQSVALARAELSESFASGDKVMKYPLAWIHLRFYHRGPDRPLALASPDRARELVQKFHRRAIEIAGLPVLEFGFIGRRALQHEVRRKYQDGRRLFIIHGLGGIGKTALATQLIHRTLQSPADDVLVLRCEGLEIDTAVTSLKDQAVEHGRRLRVEGWNEIIAEITKRLDDRTEAFEEIILHLRRYRPALIVYGDGIESLLGGPNNPGTETGEWLAQTRGLLDVINRLSDRGLLVLLSSRSLWKEHDPDSVVFVDALSGGEMMRMFDSFGDLSYLQFENKERLVPRIDGHPRTVELLDKLVHAKRLKLGVPSEELDFWSDLILPSLPDTRDRITADMLLEVLWRLLTDAGREHACRLLVARVPLPRQIVRDVGDATDELIRFGLLTRHRIQRQTEADNRWENRWAMHSIVVDYVRTKAATQHISEAHLLLGSGYKDFLESKGSSFDDLGEGVYHLHSAKAGDLAWKLTRTYVHELQLRGDFLRALVSLEECEQANVSGDNLASLLVLKAHIVMEVTGDQGKVVPLLSRALSLAISRETRESALRARGIQLRDVGQLEESEMDLLRALRLTETTEGTESLSYATCLHELAVTLGERGQLLKAEELLNKSLTIKATTCGKEHHLYASGLHHLGMLAMRFQDYDKAEPLLREAVAIKRVALGTFHRSYGHSLKVLAEILKKLGRDEESGSISVEAHMAEAFMPGTKKNSAMFFSQDLSYANRLRAVASMLAAEGREAEASKVRDVLKGMGEDENLPVELTQRTESESDEIVATVAEAERLTAAGNREAAIESLEQMTEKAVLSRTSENAAYGGLLCRLGNAYRENGVYEKSESCLREALRVALKANGEQHPASAICMASLAETLSYQERHAESHSTFKEALRLLSNAVGRNHHLYRYYLRWYATALSIGMQFGEAEAKWRELVEVNVTVQGEGYPQHARDLRELAALLGRQNKFVEAYETVSGAVDIAVRSHGRESEEYVEALWGQVHIGLLMGQPEASESLPEVLSLVEKYLEPGNKSRDEAVWVGMLHGTDRSNAVQETGTVGRSDLYRRMMVLGKLSAEKESVLRARLKAVTECDDPLKAVKQCRAVLSEAEASGEVLTQLSAHDLLSQILINLGMREEALNHARRAKHIAERIGVESIVESAEERIAELEAKTIDSANALGSRLVELSEMMHRGEFAAAVSFGRELITEAEERGALDVAASSTSFLSSALEMMGSTEEALVAARSALSMVKSLDHQEGIKHFQTRVKHLQSLDPMQTKVNILLYRAQLLRGARGDEALETIRLCEEALPLAESLGNLKNRWSIHKMLAEVFDGLGMREEGLAQALEMLNLSQTLHIAELVEESQRMIATIKERERSATDNLNAEFFRALRQKSRQERIIALEEVASDAEELSLDSIACSAHWVLAQSYGADENTESAVIHARAAVQGAKELGDEDAAAQFTAYLDELESRDPTSSNS